MYTKKTLVKNKKKAARNEQPFFMLLDKLIIIFLEQPVPAPVGHAFFPQQLLLLF